MYRGEGMELLKSVSDPSIPGDPCLRKRQASGYQLQFVELASQHIFLDGLCE